MELSDFIRYAIIGAVVAGSIQYMTKSASKPVEPIDDEGNYLIKTHKLYYLPGIAGLLTGLAFLGAGIFYQMMDLLLAALFMLSVFGLPGMYFILLAKNQQVWFNQNQIKITSWKRKISTLSWDEITGIDYSRLSGFLTINTADSSAKIFAHTVGIKSFTNMMEQQTAFTAKSIKFPIT